MNLKFKHLIEFYLNLDGTICNLAHKINNGWLHSGFIYFLLSFPALSVMGLRLKSLTTKLEAHKHALHKKYDILTSKEETLQNMTFIPTKNIKSR